MKQPSLFELERIEIRTKLFDNFCLRPVTNDKYSINLYFIQKSLFRNAQKTSSFFSFNEWTRLEAVG